MADFTPQQIEQFLQEFFDVVGARQYIGARYVPIFGRAGEDTVEWDDTAPYEPLTVVMHQGVSYVSRRYVPTGIPITDTAYWVETYRFNAQVEQYRQQVLAFQSQIDDRIPYPIDPYDREGEDGQVLQTLGDGHVRWADPVVVDEEIAQPLIEAWLDEHPEATTTVEDGAITTAKLADGAVTTPKLADGAVTDAKLAPDGVTSDVALLGAMSHAVITDEIAYSTTVTAGQYISNVNGRVISTTSDLSVTGLISVAAGSVVRVPAGRVTGSVALVARRVDNPTLLYTPLLTRAVTQDREWYLLIDEDCEVSFCGTAAMMDGFEIYESMSTVAIEAASAETAEAVDALEGSIAATDARVDHLDAMSHAVITDEIAYETTVTANQYINVNGRVYSTSSDLSVTGLISVSAGSVVRVPAGTVTATTALVGRRLDNPTLLYTPLLTMDVTGGREWYLLIDQDCEVSFCGTPAMMDGFEIYESMASDVYDSIADLREDMEDVTDPLAGDRVNGVQPVATRGQIAYVGDTSASSSYATNAVMAEDGTIFVARSGGTVEAVGYGTTQTVLTVNGSNLEWRCMFIDSDGNVYASPHASWGTMTMTQRGLYRLAPGGTTMAKVISLYDPSSPIATERTENDDTIWTMCEDGQGNLYAGVYAHTVRANPAIYKSTDGGVTWSYLFNFNNAGLTTDGRHIHAIVYSRWRDALYCIVGEVNTIFKSTDGGVTWTDLNVTLVTKGTALCPTPYGIYVGSDGPRRIYIDVLRNDDTTHDEVFAGWANTVFAIRCSDVTGWLYAFTKIDSSVSSETLWPPVTVIEGTTTIEEWEQTVTAGQYASWRQYREATKDTYPSDSIRPQHYGVLVSRDGGTSWEPLVRFGCASTAANGIWTVGYFRNGECLFGRMEDRQVLRPCVISEGRHSYVSGGCNLDGEILVRLNASAVNQPLGAEHVG